MTCCHKVSNMTLFFHHLLLLQIQRGVTIHTNKNVFALNLYKPGGGIPIGGMGIPGIDIGNGIGGIPCGGIPIICGIIGGITIGFGIAG